MRRLLKDAGFMLIAIVGLHSGTLVSSQSELLAQAPSQPKDANVEVKVVKYDGLKEAVTNLKGTLVVVDFWSTT
jgi:hypothetical protein